jgi:hypothetical protein
LGLWIGEGAMCLWSGAKATRTARILGCICWIMLIAPTMIAFVFAFGNLSATAAWIQFKSLQLNVSIDSSGNVSNQYAFEWIDGLIILGDNTQR